MKLRIGSLFSGYGGLDLAAEALFDADTVWVSDIDPGACKILAHRWPDAPNLGDITTVDWHTVPPVDVLTGGSPCQDVSAAGRRAGMRDGTRSNLWAQMREAIRVLRPCFVLWENVRGVLSADADSDVEPCPWCLGNPEQRGPDLRALGRVLGDLAELGFDAEWVGLRAADVGAPHGRFRVFVLAWPASHTVAQHGRPWWAGPGGQASTHHQFAGRGLPPVSLLPTPTAMDSKASGGEVGGSDVTLTDATVREVRPWAQYEAAVHRWEALTRPAPAPTEPNRKGGRRLSPRFPEWMMGLPDGWICDVPGVTRNEALKAAGDGVVPQQAIAAYGLALQRAGFTR